MLLLGAAHARRSALRAAPPAAAVWRARHFATSPAPNGSGSLLARLRRSKPVQAAVRYGPGAPARRARARIHAPPAC